MQHDVCDYCFREFGWTDKPVCPNCGLSNIRETNQPLKETGQLVRQAPERESGMIAPARETAVLGRPKPRRRKK